VICGNGGHGVYMSPIVACNLLNGDMEEWAPVEDYETAPNAAADAGYYVTANPNCAWQFNDGYAGDMGCEAPANKTIDDWRKAGRPFPISIRKGKSWLVLPAQVNHGIMHRSGRPVPRLRYMGHAPLPAALDKQGLNRWLCLPNYQWLFHSGLTEADLFAGGPGRSLIWQDVDTRKWGAKANVFPPECVQATAGAYVTGWYGAWAGFDDEAAFYLLGGGDDPVPLFKLDLREGVDKASCAAAAKVKNIAGRYHNTAPYPAIALSGYGGGTRFAIWPSNEATGSGIHVVNLKTNQSAHLFNGVDEFRNLMWCKARQTAVNLNTFATGDGAVGQWRLSTLKPPANPADWADESKWTRTVLEKATAHASVPAAYPFKYGGWTFRNPNGRVFYHDAWDCVIYGGMDQEHAAGYAIRAFDKQEKP
jgi:hypothetical protein